MATAPIAAATATASFGGRSVFYEAGLPRPDEAAGSEKKALVRRTLLFLVSMRERGKRREEMQRNRQNRPGDVDENIQRRRHAHTASAQKRVRTDTHTRTHGETDKDKRIRYVAWP